MYKFFFLIFVVFVSAEEPVTDIPSYLKPYVCTKSNPDYERCVRNSLENCWGYFVQGIKEMNIPPVDPLLIPLFRFSKNISSDFAIDSTMKSLWIYGAKDLQFHSVNVAPSKLKMQVSVYIPYIRMRSRYEVDASLGSKSVSLQGFIDANFTDLSITPSISVKKYERNDTEYFAVEKFDVKFGIGNGHVFLSGSTEEEHASAQFFMKFFNQDPRGVTKSITPALTQRLNKLITEGLNEYLSHLPASKLQPE